MHLHSAVALFFGLARATMASPVSDAEARAGLKGRQTASGCDYL